VGKHNSKLSQDQLTDLTKATNFDRKELQQWYKGFLKGNLRTRLGLLFPSRTSTPTQTDCPAGTLDKNEFQKIYKQFFPFGDPTNFSEFVFNVFGTPSRLGASSDRARCSQTQTRTERSTLKSLSAPCQ